MRYRLTGWLQSLEVHQLCFELIPELYLDSEQVPHHHVIFTIPKMLRAYFRYDRSLLNDLSRAANRTILIYLRILLGDEIHPGLVVARHTFGEGARFHPHLHAIVTGGGWDTDHNWHAVFGWGRPALRELFQIEVFRFLRERELLSAERVELIRSWRHSGFDVYSGAAIEPGNRQMLGHIARYLIHIPDVRERQVTYYGCLCQCFPVPAAEEEV